MLALAAVALTGQVTSAQEEVSSSPAPKEATILSVAFEPSSMEGIPHYLSARLVAADGSAIVGERVSIRRVVDVFGGRTVTIGRATTDNAGIARVPIVPREEAYRVSATFAGTDALASSKIEGDVVFPAETVFIPEEVPRGGLVDPQLRPVAELMPVVITAAVIGVWAVLIGVTVFTLHRIRSSRRSDADAPDHASAELPGTGSGSPSG